MQEMVLLQGSFPLLEIFLITECNEIDLSCWM